MAKAKNSDRSGKSTKAARRKSDTLEEPFRSILMQAGGHDRHIMPRLLEINKASVSVSPEIRAGLKECYERMQHAMVRIGEVIHSSRGMSLHRAEIIHAALCSLQVADTAIGAHLPAEVAMNNAIYRKLCEIKASTTKGVRGRNAD